MLTSPNSVSQIKFDPSLKLGVLASGNGSNFEYLVKLTKKSNLNIAVSMLIVNNKGCGAHKKAERLGIPVKVIDHRLYKSREDIDREIISTFSSLNIDLIVMAGWMRIVSSILTNEYKERIVNIHPSLLPSFRGLNAVNQAIESGAKITGCTVHLVNAEVDSGKVLIQSAVPIYDNDTSKTLSHRIQEQEHQILFKGVILAGHNLRQPK